MAATRKSLLRKPPHKGLKLHDVFLLYKLTKGRSVHAVCENSSSTFCNKAIALEETDLEDFVKQYISYVFISTYGLWLDGISRPSYQPEQLISCPRCLLAYNNLKI